MTDIDSPVTDPADPEANGAPDKGGPPGEPTDTEELRYSFESAVREGAARLRRSWVNLFASGLIAGVDIGFGVLALLFVQHATGSSILGGLAFTIGFLALALGRGELFTENFLVPVTAVVARKGTVGGLARLWAATYVTNLIGGWGVAALLVMGYPDIRPTVESTAEEIIERGVGIEAFVLAVFAGAAITLMTWMERNARGEGGRLLAVVAMSFLLGAAHMNHVVVGSIKLFAALQVGADFGYLDWLGLSTLAMVGNVLGGLLLVTVLRVVQVGSGHIEALRRTTIRVPDDARGGTTAT